MTPDARQKRNRKVPGEPSAQNVGSNSSGLLKVAWKDTPKKSSRYKSRITRLLSMLRV